MSDALRDHINEVRAKIGYPPIGLDYIPITDERKYNRVWIKSENVWHDIVEERENGK